MAKELPYFRFTPQEWQNGDIGLESYEMKGIFIDICSYYWLRDCSLTLAMLQKKFSDATGVVEVLLNLHIIGWDKKTDYVQINFLNEQYDMLSEKRKRRQDAGSKGGKQKSSNATAMLKQKPSYKDKDKDKDKDKYITQKKFYNNQSEIATAHKKEYDFFIKLIFGENDLDRPLNSVLSVRDQVTYKQFEKLMETKKKNNKSIALILLQIENDPKYTKGKVNLFLTINNWLIDKNLK